jgi:hypothetical protein
MLTNEMKFHGVALPNRQYEWNVDATQKGAIGNDGMFVSKDREG